MTTMTERMRVQTRRGPVEWSFERPHGLKVLPRPVPTLGYPWEVAGAGDWDFPPSCPSNEAEEELYGDLPRVDLMPPDGVFVWLVMGDLGLDYEVIPRSGPPIVPHQRVAPVGVAPGNGVDARVVPFRDADRVDGKFPQLFSWERLVFLTGANGDAPGEPLYLIMRAFAGPRRSNIATVNSLVSSLRYSYMG